MTARQQGESEGGWPWREKESIVSTKAQRLKKSVSRLGKPKTLNAAGKLIKLGIPQQPESHTKESGLTQGAGETTEIFSTEEAHDQNWVVGRSF